MQSIKSGEGFVFDFTGPGDIMVQTRNQQQLVFLDYLGWRGSTPHSARASSRPKNAARA